MSCLAPTGVKFLLEDEAVQVGGSNHSHATQVRTSTQLDAAACGGWTPGASGGRPAASTHCR